MSEGPKRHAPRGPVKKLTHPIQQADPIQRGHFGPRCTATSKTTGKGCQSPAIQGGTVCRMHGGSAPQVKEAALARLLRLQHPAIGRLEDLMNQVDFPTVAYQAVRDVLDRTMGKPHESSSVAVSGGLSITHEVPE